jgi:S1-C subfamily serine protease
MVRTVVAQAVAGSKSVARPWIGVVCQDVTPEIASSLGLTSPRGALITHVDDGSPAAKAGLKVGDLIRKAGDRDIADSASFDYRLAVSGIGSSMPLTIWRDGEERVIPVVTDAEPQLQESDLTLIGGRSPLTGAVVADLNASLADRLRIRGADQGAVIVDVEPMSPAARMGFRKGDVVLGAQGETVTSVEQLTKLVETQSRLWRIRFSRDGRVSSIVIGG